MAVVANAYSLHPRWPDYWRVLEDGGYRSQLSAPMLLGAERSAALTLLSSRDNVFTPSVIDSVLVFGKRAAASYVIAENLRAAQLAAEQLRSALDSRTPIDAACGVIMAQNRCSYDEAFQIIAKASSYRNLKVRVIAEKILATVPGEAPAGHAQ